MNNDEIERLLSEILRSHEKMHECLLGTLTQVGFISKTDRRVENLEKEVERINDRIKSVTRTAWGIASSLVLVVIERIISAL